jgi:hypothetical protein
MEFYDYPDNFEALKRSGLDKQLGIRNRSEMYTWFAHANARSDNPLGYRHMMFDMMWHRDGKPYYNVYPSIIPMLTRLNLNFAGNAVSHVDGDLYVDDGTDFILGPLKILSKEQAKKMDEKITTSGHRFTNLLIRLPKVNHGLSYEDPTYGHTPIRTIFASFQPVNKTVGSRHVTFGLVVGMDVGEREESGIPVHTMRIFPLDERPIEDCIHSLPRHSRTADIGLQIPDELMVTCIRLVITLCILDDNPELIEPDVLNKDKQRYLDGDEELRQRLIEKAKRRGKYGFVVGKEFEPKTGGVGEKSPHVRIQHPCLFWTGQGRETPIIKTRKGSLIHRKKVENVPTGYQSEKLAARERSS